jgi:hypothetical protein
MLHDMAENKMATVTAADSRTIVREYGDATVGSGCREQTPATTPGLFATTRDRASSMDICVSNGKQSIRLLTFRLRKCSWWASTTADRRAVEVGCPSVATAAEERV